MDQEKRIIITCCVDPHHFYFKYVDDDYTNTDYTNFDYVVQSYANDIFARKVSPYYRPDKNELIVFFDILFNKWLRGRVTNVDNDEITLWCIDNGITRKSDKQFIQPLSDSLKQDFKLVHLGGLSVLPAERILNLDTLNVKMQLTHSWDNEMKNNFQMIIDSAKRIYFTEEWQMENHKFGSLLTETKNDNVVVINDILLQMNKAISCGSTEDMPTYVSEKRFKRELYQVSKATAFNPDKAMATSSASSKSKIEAKSFDLKPSADVSGQSGIELLLKPVRLRRTSSVTSNASGESAIEVQLKPIQPKSVSNAFGKLEVEVHSQPFEPMASSKANGEPATEVQLKPVQSKSASNATDPLEVEVHSKPFAPSATHNAYGGSTIEVQLNAVQPKSASNASGQLEVEAYSKPIESSVHSNAVGEPATEVQLQPVQPTNDGKSAIEVHSQPFDFKPTYNESGQSAIENSSNRKPKIASNASDGPEKQNQTKPPSFDGFRSTEENHTMKNDDVDGKTVTNSKKFPQKNEGNVSASAKLVDFVDNSTSVPDYICHLKTLTASHSKSSRQPKQSSMDWINQFGLSVGSCAGDRN